MKFIEDRSCRTCKYQVLGEFHDLDRCSYQDDKEILFEEAYCKYYKPSFIELICRVFRKAPKNLPPSPNVSSIRKGDRKLLQSDNFIVIVEDAGKNFAAYSPNVYGCVSTGDTIAKTIKNYSEALEFHLKGAKEDEKEA